MALDFPNSPVVGATYTSGPGGPAWQWDGVKWESIGVPGATGAAGPVSRNLIHNPYFNIQQRGTGPWTASGAYTADRWQIFVNLDTDSVALTAMADTDRATIGDEAAIYALQCTFTGSASAGSYSVLVQPIEALRRLSGKIVTVSFWARATSGTPRVGVGFYQVFGSGGSPSGNVGVSVGVTPALSTTWQRCSFTVTMPSTSGKTFGTTAGTDYSRLDLWLSAQGTSNLEAGGIGVQSGTVQFWGMQLEIGSVATPLEKIDPRYDLANCLRFYQLWSPPPIRGGAATGGSSVSRMGMPLPVPMRAAPTVTLVSALPVYNANQTNTITSFSNNYSTTQTLEIDGVVSAAWTATSPTPTMVYMNAGGSVTLSADF